MKLFQRLLVAPAALGLMLPMVANASEQIDNTTNRVQELENNVSAFEAGVFSGAQTKASGESIFVIGGIDQKDSTEESITFHYHHILELESSFTGEDLLLTAFESGNFGGPFAGEDVALEANYDSEGSPNTLVMAKMFYQFPIGEDFTVTLGPKVRQDDILGVWPSAYPSDTILDVLTYAGASAAYSLAEGVGVGVSYLSDSRRWSASALAISSEGDDATQGIWKENADDTLTTQLAYLGERWTIAVANTIADAGQNWSEGSSNDQYNAWGVSGIYQIDAGRRPSGDDITLIPSSISGGIGWKNVVDEDDSLDIEDSRTYSLGVVWTDAFSEGNDFGIAWGTAEDQINDGGYDDPHAWEIYYAMGIGDNITVTPAFFKVEKDDAPDYQGVVVKTTFTF